MPRATIALALLAHNEARYLPRVQAELGSRINSVVIISDPPNDDGTIEVAKEVFSTKYDRVEIIERPWPEVKDASSTARNEVMDKARAMGDDYVLWLDPDSPLVGSIPDELTEPVYAFLTVDKPSNASWVMPHLVRADMPGFRWFGRCHEYLDTGPHRMAVLNTAIVERNGSGGSIPRMREHDLPTLIEQVEDEPDNPRWVYYLAQTYRDIGDAPNAIKWYQKRSLMAGFVEETFYSLFMLGCLYQGQGDDAQAEFWFMKAHLHRPSRQEPLNQLVELYQRKQEFVLAIDLMKRVMTLPPSEDVLVVHNRPIAVTAT